MMCHDPALHAPAKFVCPSTGVARLFRSNDHATYRFTSSYQKGDWYPMVEWRLWRE